jgi:hypothetical protein
MRDPGYNGTRNRRSGRALAPWLAALETDSDQGGSQATESKDRVRGAVEQVEFEHLFSQYGAALLD